MKNTLYVATNGLSVWYSEDNGETLTRLQSDSGMYSGSQVWSLATHPQRRNELLAGTEIGIFRMDRAKKRWKRLAFDADKTLVTALAYAPDDPDIILAGTQPAGLHRSDDGGRTWRRLDAPMAEYLSISVVDGHIRAPADSEEPIRHWTRVTQILFDPADSSKVWAGVEIDNVWRSTDGGRTWTKHRNGLISADIHGFAVVSNGQRKLFAATNEGLHVSRDEGQTWEPQRLNSPWQYVRSVAARPDGSGVVFLTNGDGPPGTDGRLLRSRDFGASWENAGLPGEVQSTIYTLAVNEADPNLIFAASSLGQIYRSQDGGENWQAMKRRLGEIRAIAWLPN